MNIKTFEIDIDSIDDCKRLQNTLNSIIGQLQAATNGSRKEKFKSMFDACVHIANTDISSLYNNIALDTTPIYYVYAHCDPDANIAIGKNGVSTFAATLGMTKLPFYIGKGTGSRAYNLNRNESHRKVRQRLQKFNKDIEVSIFKNNLTELEALMLESKLIDMFGLTSVGGRLVNLDEGVNKDERRLLYKEQLHDLNRFYKNSV